MYAQYIFGRRLHRHCGQHCRHLMQKLTYQSLSRLKNDKKFLLKCILSSNKTIFALLSSYDVKAIAIGFLELWKLTLATCTVGANQNVERCDPLLWFLWGILINFRTLVDQTSKREISRYVIITVTWDLGDSLSDMTASDCIKH